MTVVTPASLDASFYHRPAEVVAPALLGCLLVRRWRGEELVARIVETEAYLPDGDAASHAHKGRTGRNAPMFGPPGRAYVYFIYGVHDMFNVVCESDGVPAAVLIRAAQPVQGTRRMQRWRGVRHAHQVASGPGKLCQALRIGASLNRHALWRPPLWIAPGSLRDDERLGVSARIGVAYAGRDAARPLRFFIRDHPHVTPRRAST